MLGCVRAAIDAVVRHELPHIPPPSPSTASVKLVDDGSDHTYNLRRSIELPIMGPRRLDRYNYVPGYASRVLRPSEVARLFLVARRVVYFGGLFASMHPSTVRPPRRRAREAYRAGAFD